MKGRQTKATTKQNITTAQATTANQQEDKEGEEQPKPNNKENKETKQPQEKQRETNENKKKRKHNMKGRSFCFAHTDWHLAETQFSMVLHPIDPYLVPWPTKLAGQCPWEAKARPRRACPKWPADMLMAYKGSAWMLPCKCHNCLYPLFATSDLQ